MEEKHFFTLSRVYFPPLNLKYTCTSGKEIRPLRLMLIVSNNLRSSSPMK